MQQHMTSKMPKHDVTMSLFLFQKGSFLQKDSVQAHEPYVYGHQKVLRCDALVKQSEFFPSDVALHLRFAKDPPKQPKLLILRSAFWHLQGSPVQNRP